MAARATATATPSPSWSTPTGTAHSEAGRPSRSVPAYGASLAMSLFFFSSRRRHTRWPRDWSSDVCSSDLVGILAQRPQQRELLQSRESLTEDVDALRLERVEVIHAGLIEARNAGNLPERGVPRQVVPTQQAVGRIEIGRASCRERV